MRSDLELVGRGSASAAGSMSMPAAPFRRLLDAIGRPVFYSELGALFGEIWGAEHVHFWLFEGTKPNILSGFSADGSGYAEHLATTYMARELWHHDTAMSAGSQIEGDVPALFRLDTTRPLSSEIRNFYTGAHMRDRLVMCGRERFGTLGISLVRSGRAPGPSAEATSPILPVSDAIFRMLVRHVEICARDRSFLRAFASLEKIEEILARAPDRMPSRQAQVCARFLYGLSATSIAADLHLSPETVLSYRKRLYQRMAISSHRELMLWYLELHTDLAEPDHDAACLRH
ncbi:hypothetical protein C100_12620 [Sphingobium sp. C100]|uniref:helix-turn-helix transcriptional regulator n=1 Tax=Sphingobium sp. C100 TaxID=1207055 RepID=UPI0003D5EA46|nr:LuxR C-terminal-related transcriptional regulator [Sphingobium sp. C100]ETI63486.1 hypothetical protein C100_12620 [Sphingobium sp. C100]PHQ64334.1 MAG: hypothetical protein COC10_01425 [Sphingobium sp.]